MLNQDTDRGVRKDNDVSDPACPRTTKEAHDVFTRTMQRLWRDDLVRLRTARRHSHGQSPGSAPLHLPDPDPPLAHATAARSLTHLVNGGWLRLAHAVTESASFPVEIVSRQDVVNVPAGSRG